jgi:hypothetical protein
MQDPVPEILMELIHVIERDGEPVTVLLPPYHIILSYSEPFSLLSLLCCRPFSIPGTDRKQRTKIKCRINAVLNELNRTVAGSYFVRWESGRPLYNYCFKQWLGDKTTVEKMQELIAFCYQKANEGYYEIRSQFYDL